MSSRKNVGLAALDPPYFYFSPTVSVKGKFW